MAAEEDRFIIGCSALWAGDFEYFEKLLRQYSYPLDVEPIDHGAESPEDFIRATAALRLRQLWQKRGEFKKLAREYALQGVEITDKPTILETKHLRATLWRTGSREFLLQGYLTDLSWQEGLFSHARRVADAAENPKSKSLIQRNDMFEEEEAGESFTGLGAAWVVAENPFIQVELTDLGLLEATGIWTGRELPDAAAAITQPFLKLLHKLDVANPSA